MDILIVMCMGILVGRLFRSGRIKKVNELLSLACTFVLIFAMGGTLGQRENFVREFLSLLFFHCLCIHFDPEFYGKKEV